MDGFVAEPSLVPSVLLLGLLPFGFVIQNHFVSQRPFEIFLVVIRRNSASSKQKREDDGRYSIHLKTKELLLQLVSCVVSVILILIHIGHRTFVIRDHLKEMLQLHV